MPFLQVVIGQRLSASLSRARPSRLIQQLLPAASRLNLEISLNLPRQRNSHSFPQKQLTPFVRSQCVLSSKIEKSSFGHVAAVEKQEFP